MQNKMASTFKAAIQTITFLRDAYLPGLEALNEGDRRRISYDNSRNLTGSVNLDKALKDLLPNDPSWDYGIGYKVINTEYTLWVELHPASSSRHVEEVLQKLRWLKSWLGCHGAALRRFPSAYFWLSTDGVALSPHSPQRRRLSQAGLRGSQSMLNLDRDL